MKTLVLCDDIWHPAQRILDGLKPLESHGVEFDWVVGPRDALPGCLTDYPLVILGKSNHTSSTDEAPWMTKAIAVALCETIRNGAGLLALHSGTSGYDSVPGMLNLLGGSFIHHPHSCPVTVSPLAGHPLTEGCDSFTLSDEQYFMRQADPQADVFMTTLSEHGEQPGGWRRTAGAGRVAVLTPSHSAEVWQHPAFQRLLLNSMRWCSKTAEPDPKIYKSF